MKAFLSTILSIGLSTTLLAACSGSGSGTADGGMEASHGGDAGKDTAPPVDTGPPPCIEKNCDVGNKCLPDSMGVVACQLPCNSQYGQSPPPGQKSMPCPLNYTCTDFPAGTPSGSADRAYCTADTKAYTPPKNATAPGIWGAPCLPAGGITSNPACDSSQGFLCNATSPTDAQAYCTILCSSDSDCRGGWWCATQNLEPNASSNGRLTSGKTVQVCQPRNYCASCTSDVDCDSTTGVPEHCILDREGTSYCAPECTKDGNCNTEAQCITLDQSALCKSGAGTCICAARARECTGDGKLCAPCLSDDDCKQGGPTSTRQPTDGLCLAAEYSTEHFCGVPSGSKAPTCSVSGTMLVADCPTKDEAPNKQISCLTGPYLYDPANQCVGLVTFGSTSSGPQYIVGCWTPNR
jgi:hypothetical protein